MERVFRLLNAGRKADAIRTIVDARSGRLRCPFRRDGNFAWYVVGDIYWRSNRPTEALRAFFRALKAWPEDVESMWAIGNCYAEVGRPGIAERYFRRALKRVPRNESIRFNLGNALFDQKRFREAVREYRKISSQSSPIGEKAARNLELSLAALREKRSDKGSGSN